MVLCDSRHQFAASHGTCFSVQYSAYNIRFLLTMFKEGAGNVSLPLADMSLVTANIYTVHCIESFIEAR